MIRILGSFGDVNRLMLLDELKPASIALLGWLLDCQFCIPYDCTRARLLIYKLILHIVRRKEKVSTV
jgi:hypothetical protein